MEKVFGKLVRDLIPEIIESRGEVAVTRVLNDQEYQRELYKKLREECEEVISSTTTDEVVEELADVYEVMQAILTLEGKSISDVEEVAYQKKKKRGGFQKKIYLEKTYDKKGE